MTDRIKLTWSDIWRHHDAARNDLTVYDSDGNAWRRNPAGSAWREALHRSHEGIEAWTPEDDETVWIDPPPIAEPPDGTRIEFENATDVYAAWRDDASSEQAGWLIGDGGEVWCLYGSTVPRTWAVMWLEFGDSLATAVRLTAVPEDVPNYAKWLTSQIAAREGAVS